MKCSKCNAENNNTSTFCWNCGTGMISQQSGDFNINADNQYKQDNSNKNFTSQSNYTAAQQCNNQTVYYNGTPKKSESNASRLIGSLIRMLIFVLLGLVLGVLTDISVLGGLLIGFLLGYIVECIEGVIWIRYKEIERKFEEINKANIEILNMLNNK